MSSKLIAIGYARVSTSGQANDGVSLDAQRARVQAWCDANGYRLADLHVDAGLSGKRADNRPGLQRALAAVCRLKGALVTYSLSRLARSTRDAIDIAERLDRAGADIVSLTESIDSRSAAGKMIFRLLAVLAEFERDLVSERTTAALAHKRRNGERTGEVPFGWSLADDGVRLDPIPGEQAVIVEIKRLRAAGRTLREIASEMTRCGIRTKKNAADWTHQSIGSILRRASMLAG